MFGMRTAEMEREGGAGFKSAQLKHTPANWLTDNTESVFL